jgi:hypothetical protein
MSGASGRRNALHRVIRPAIVSDASGAPFELQRRIEQLYSSSFSPTHCNHRSAGTYGEI